jgi:hypothetical protein
MKDLNYKSWLLAAASAVLAFLTALGVTSQDEAHEADACVRAVLGDMDSQDWDLAHSDECAPVIQHAVQRLTETLQETGE